MAKIYTTLEREIYGEGYQKGIKLDNGEEYRIRTTLERDIKTGFQQLDDIIGSISPGELHVIAGRPAMGKTTLMLDIALHIATSYHTLTQ